MLGVYLSEDAIEELNIFIEARTKSTKGGASTMDSTLKSMKYTTDSVDTKDSIKMMKYTTDSVDTKDSIKMMNSMSKHDSTMDSTNSSSESKLIGTMDSAKVMSSTTDSASTMDSTASTTDSTEPFRSNEVRIYRGSSKTTVEDTHNHTDEPTAVYSRSCKDACNEGKGKVNSSLPINSDIVEDHITLFLKVLDLNRKDVDYKDVTDHIMMDDPKTFKEAMSQADSEQWKIAVITEYNNLKRKGVLKEVRVPRGAVRLIDSKLVFKRKYKDGKMSKYKARLCAKGFTQVEGEDYNETFAPVARMNTIRLFLKISISRKHKRRTADWLAAFCNGYLNEELYMNPPELWEVKAGHILKLMHALYGTKQAGRSWYQQLKDYMINELKLIMCESDQCVFYRKDYSLLILLYVDDVIISYEREEDYQITIAKIKKDFEIGDEGELSWYLGNKIEEKENYIKMSQTEYINKIIKKYEINGLEDTPMIKDYAIVKSEDDELFEEFNIKSKIGSLMYVAVCTRPDVMFAVSYIARFTNHPNKDVCKAITRIFKYLNATKDYSLKFEEGKCSLSLQCDADFGGDVNDGKSTSGGCALLDEDIIDWWAKKQTTITAQATCDSELLSLNLTCKNTIWTRGILHELGINQKEPTIIYCDNQSAIQVVYNPVLHQRTKHMRLKIGYVNDLIRNDEARIAKIEGEKNLADIFTKSQDKKRHIKNVIGLKLPEDNNAKRNKN
jgi:hypothetical protein